MGKSSGVGVSKVEFKYSRAGFVELRNSTGVQDELLRRAEKIKDSAEGMSLSGAVYNADVQPGKTRAHALVKTTDCLSMKSNAKNNALLKSMDAGR